jgi:hypothetical protein
MTPGQVRKVEASVINRPSRKSARAVGKSRRYQGEPIATTAAPTAAPARRVTLPESEFRPGPRDQSDWECN